MNQEDDISTKAGMVWNFKTTCSSIHHIQ